MNPATPAESGFRVLPGFDVVAFEGPDAAAFLQAQLASDVSTLSDGEWQWSSWLGAQGRVLFLLLLLRTGPEGFHAVVAHGRGDELVQRLGRYVLRAKLRITRLPARASGCIAEDGRGDARPQCRGIASRAGAHWHLALGGSRARQLRLGPEPEATMDGGAWAQADIEDGVPWVHAAAADRETPQAMGLERLGAYSLHKGCYPGQEIVARTHFLGRNKRRLLRFRAATAAAPAPGDALTSGDGSAVATVVAAASDGGAVSGLAVLRGEPGLPMATSGGAPVVVEELP